MNDDIIAKDNESCDEQHVPNDVDSNNALKNHNCDDTDKLVQFIRNQDKNHNKKQTDTTADPNTRMIDILKKREDNNNKIIKDSMDAETKQLGSLLREAFSAYQGKHWTTAATKYKTALEIITNSEGELQNVVNGDVVCYMLCITWLETSQLNNLTEALQSLKNLENRSAHVLPAVYSALSKVHQKLFRFGLALKTVQKGFDFLNSNIDFQPYNIPGSNILLDETTRDGLSIALATIKEECSKWHIPDAVCSMTECISNSMHYGPSRDIFIRDPTFTGMVTVTCSNTRNPCNINFHQACWKLKKDQISPLTKSSDKDMIGHECFTPNCENDKEEVSLIAKIDIIGEDGQVKAHIEAPPNPVAKVKPPIITRGAIPKQTVKPRKPLDKIKKPKIAPLLSLPKETVNDGDTEMAWRLSLLKDLRRTNFGIKPENEWRPDREMYGNPQMKIVFKFLDGPVARNDSSKMVDFKSFVYTYFYEFIKENGYVKTLDVLQHWEESKMIFTNSTPDLDVDIDICEFLIESQKIAKIDDYFCIAENLPMLYGVVKDQLQNCLRFVLVESPSMKAAALEDDDILNLIAGTRQKSISLLSKVEEESEMEINAPDQLNCQKSTKDTQTTRTIFQADAEFVENPPSFIFPNIVDDSCDEINSNVNYPDEIQTTTDNSEPQSQFQSWNSYDVEALDNRLGVKKANSTVIGTENFVDTDLENDACYHSAESDAGEKNSIDLETCEPEICESEICEIENEDSETSEAGDTESDITVDFDLECGQAGEQNAATNLPKLESQNLTVQQLQINTKNDAATNLIIIEQLKPTLRQVDKGSENHARRLQAAFEIQKNVFRSRLTALVKNLTQLESDNAKLELDNSVSAENCKKLSIDLETLKCVHNTLISQKNQSDNNYDRLNVELKKLKESYSLLESGNRSYNSRIDNFNQERNELERKLHEYQTFLQKEKQEKEELLREKNMLEQENIELVQTLSSIQHSNEVLKRDIKLRDITHEYLTNELKCKNMMDQGSFYLETLSAASRIIWELTKQNLDTNEARTMWEKTFSNVSDIIMKNQDEYLRLKKMLESTGSIDNLNDLKLSTFNIEQPKVCSVAEILYNQRPNFLSVLTPTMRYCMPQETRNPYPPPTQGLGLPFMMPPMIPQPYNNPPNTLPLPHPAFMNNMRPSMYMSPNKPQFHLPSNLNQQSLSMFHVNSNERNTSRKPSGDTNRSSLADSGERNKIKTDVQTALTENMKLLEQNRGSRNNVLSSNNGITLNLPENPPSNSSVERKDTPQRTFGFDHLIGRLRKRFVGVPELDLLESIQELRASRNGTLSGATIDQIIHDIESFVKKNQAKHLIFNTDIEKPEAPVPVQKETQSKFVPVTVKKVSANGKQPRSDLKEMDLQFKRPESAAKPVKAATSNKPVWAPVTPNFVNWTKDDEENECVICMEKMVPHDKSFPVYALPCQHSFHTACIKLWLTENSVCPNCRIHCTMNDEFPPLPS